MSALTRSRWIKRLGIGALALVGIGAAGLRPAPADARVFVDFGYPGYVAAYPYAYTAYGYAPYYGYPYGGAAYIGFGGYHSHW